MRSLLRIVMSGHLVAASFFITTATNAGTILQPVAASSNVGNLQGTSPPEPVPAHLIDQSGLSVGYTSGVTDFDIYLDSLISYAHGRFSVALVRYSGNHEEGEQERGYAYVQDGKLEEEFSTGQKVPQRFIDQLSKSI